MKLALTSPPTPYLVSSQAYGPLGLGCLSAYIRRELPWVEVKIVDLSSGRDMISAIIDLSGQDVCGWTATSLDYERVRGLARRVSRVNSNSVTHILGGAHGTALPERVDMTVFTSIIRGEGEVALKRCLLDMRYAGKAKPVYDPIPIPNLDALPFPDRPIPEAKQLQGGAAQSATIMASRGCPYKCAYCGTHAMWPGRVRWRSPYNVAAEVSRLHDQGVTDFAFIDDNLTTNTLWLTELCRHLGDLGVRWRALSRVDRANPSVLRLMQRSGCTEICYGVESFDQDVLDRLDKKITYKQASRAIVDAAEAGLKTRVFLMISTPGETYRRTVDRNRVGLELLDPQIGMVTLNTFMPLPGSPIWNRPRDYGVRIVETDLSKMNRYHHGPGGENEPWSPIRIDGMTYAEQLENIREMRACLANLGRENRGTPCS
jgi:radical SAM superfamily enzyme YgiQ (UPF0313 family)